MSRQAASTVNHALRGIRRSLKVKRIDAHFKKPRTPVNETEKEKAKREKEPPKLLNPPLDQILRRVATDCPTLGDRHLPAIRTDADLSDDVPCCYIDNIEQSPNLPGVSFRITAYTRGRRPNGWTPDFSAVDGEAAPSDLQDVEGNRQEMVFQASMLCFNEILIYEAVQGARCLDSLTRLARMFVPRFGQDDFLQLSLLNATNPESWNRVQGPDVKSVTLEVVRGGTDGTNPVSQSMVDTSRRFKAQKVRTVVTADSEVGIPQETVKSVGESFENNELDLLRFYMKNGDVIDGNSVLLQKSVEIPAVAVATPARDAVVRELRNYLHELQGDGIITTMGELA